MPQLIVPCSHCLQASRLDSERLPDGPAYFACPRCKKKVVVDKRQLMNQESTEAAGTTAAASGPATVASSAPADRRFPTLPADATFPSGIILGEDDDTVREVQQMLATLGSETDQVSSPDVARQMIINEQPDLCIYVGGEIPDPPYAPMAPLTGLPPAFRRRIYLVLIADNLKTLDGNAAFMYQVNMILTKQDFPQFGAALYSGINYHNRLYRPYFQAAENKGLI